MNEFWRWVGSIPWGVWITIVALLGVWTIVVLLIRYARAKRELLHAERIRAIEAGLPWQEPKSAQPESAQPESAEPGAKFMHNAFWISFWVVVSVPSASFSAAATATKELHVDQLALGIAAWSAAALVSVAAVVCATTLMIYSRSRRESRDSDSTNPRKPT